MVSSITAEPTTADPSEIPAEQGTKGSPRQEHADISADQSENPRKTDVDF
jgi:hypothetical protein